MRFWEGVRAGLGRGRPNGGYQPSGGVAMDAAGGRGEGERAAAGDRAVLVGD
jgi:hypothetical protein